jgi:Kef-type K+ transport system membrane component KefB
MKIILVYIVYLVMLIILLSTAIVLVFSGNPLFIIAGIVGIFFLIVVYGCFINQEILYWASKREKPNGWEDDLTNQL